MCDSLAVCSEASPQGLALDPDTPEAMSITALIHTRNEEANLPDCLASVCWADEIVVADQASTDRTRTIAAEHGARILDMPYTPVGLVEPTRNLAIEQCHGDWITVVDADERVPPRLAGRLRELSKTATESAFWLPRRNYFLGTWLEHGFWPDYQVRFFRKGKVTWSGMLHEHPKVEGNIVELPPDGDAALEHPGYGNDLRRFIDKLFKYAPMDAERVNQTSSPAVWPYLLRRPLGEFTGRYLRCQAWRHGMPGLIWSLLLANYQLLVAIHYWALSRASANVPADPAALRRSVRCEALREGIKWLKPW